MRRIKQWIIRSINLLCFLGSCILGVHHSAKAGSVCDGLHQDSPDLYQLYCKDGGSGNSRPAGATSSFSDAFNLNSAAIPTETSPYGLEVISTFLNSGASPGFPTLALVKGFHRFGTGISTSAGNTFYSNDLIERLRGPSRLQTLDDPETAKGKFFNLNLGTSFLLLDANWLPRVQLGLSGRYNRITNTWGGGPAILVSIQNFSLGYGVTREKVSNFLPSTNFTSFLLGFRISIFEFEYNVLTANLPAANLQGVSLSPVQILTGNFTFHNFVITAAYRTLDYLQEGSVTELHFGMQYYLSSHFALGYLYNYVPGGNSIGAQVYL